METQQETVPAAEVAAPSPRPWAIHPSKDKAETHTITKVPDGVEPWAYFEQDICDDHGRILGSLGMWTAGKRGGWPRVDTEAETRANIDYVLRAVNSFDKLTDELTRVRNRLLFGDIVGLGERLLMVGIVDGALSTAGVTFENGEELA